MPPVIAAVTGFVGSIAATKLGGALLNLLGSIALSYLAQLLRGTPERPDTRQDIQFPNSLPPKRFAYGRARVPGTWAPGWVTDGSVLWGAVILNSRPSAGGSVTILLDKRPVELTGDLLDFAVGATATNMPFAGHVTAWLGLGDQSGPPAQVLAEWGDPAGIDATKFWPTDRWSGCTVLWLRLINGAAETRQQRWPNGRPEVEVEADWSVVWDPRDPAQDPDDPATWTFSDNQALCLLDAIRRNPMRRRPLRQIDVPSFVRSADVADEAVPVRGGGSEPRYRVGGLVVWSGAELLDQLAPLVLAGGGEVVQGAGRLGHVPGVWEPAPVTVVDALAGQPMRFRARAPLREVPRAVRAQYPDPDAQWEQSELRPDPVPGAEAWDGSDDGVEPLRLGLVPYVRQAMRLQRMTALKRGAVRRLSCELPPDAIALTAGSVVATDFGTGDPRNGTWMVERARPAIWLEGEDGVAFRIPVDLREWTEAIFAWTPDDEQDLPEVPFDPSRVPPEPPTEPLLTDGGAVEIGDGNFVPRVRLSFLPAPGSVQRYDWELRPAAGGPWAPQPPLGDAQAIDGRITGFALNEDFIEREARVRAVSAGGVSAWVVVPYTPPPPPPPQEP